MNIAALKGWRTLAFNLLIAVGAAAGTITGEMSTETAIKVILIAAVNAGLRFITTTPVGKGDV